MTDMGRYFGNISCSAVIKTVVRFKAKMEKDRAARGEMAGIEEALSNVNG